MAFIDRNGVRIAYDVIGQGPAILLTHGYAASSHMFKANAAALAIDHTVITWDMRGHGQSDYPTDPAEYSADRAVGDILALLDTVGAGRAVIGGHSLGGYLSLAFNRDRPDRVRALVMIDTGPGFRNPEGRQRWNDMAERRAVAFEKHGLEAIAGEGELDPTVHRDSSGLILAARAMLPQQDASVMESLPDIRVPTLVIVGEDDSGFIAGSEYMAAKIPAATLKMIPGDHAPNLSNAATFDAVLREFLDSLPPDD